MSRKPEQQQQRQSSSRCSFGVKSYVHKFYENRSADYDESVYEATGSANPNGEEDQIALTSPPKYPCAYSKRYAVLENHKEREREREREREK